jgi:hypothetical protein
MKGQPPTQPSLEKPLKKSLTGSVRRCRSEGEVPTPALPIRRRSSSFGATRPTREGNVR